MSDTPRLQRRTSTALGRRATRPGHYGRNQQPTRDPDRPTTCAAPDCTARMSMYTVNSDYCGAHAHLDPVKRPAVKKSYGLCHCEKTWCPGGPIRCTSHPRYEGNAA